MRVGASTYTENTPAARVYEITECRGDMNNDGSVDFGDINPFVLALNNPAGFGDVHPGLDGSMVYHADVNRDGYFDFGDINCFVALLALPNPPCSEQCDEWCPSDPGSLAALPGPGELAAMLETHIAPKLRPALLDVVAGAAQWQSDPGKRKYWEEVYDALVK